MKVKCFSILAFLLVNFAVVAQSPVRFDKKEQIITINPKENSFTRIVKTRGTCDSNAKNHIPLYFGELEKITKLTAQYKEGRKWKKLNKKEFVTQSVLTNSFYDGLKKTTIPFPPQKIPYSFQYNYQETTSELLFLSLLNFNNLNTTDTFFYQIILPSNYKLHYNIEKELAETNLVTVNEKKLEDRKIYSFIAIPNKIIPYDKTIKAWIRLMVTPTEQSPYDYYNDWYRNLTRPNAILTDNIKKSIANKIDTITSDKERIAAVFNLIKNKIHYIAIENGIGAVMPRDVNKTWNTQQGDCKDMSNLLYAVLRDLGYEAHLALSATIGHAFDLDFPSLASANHVITVLNFEGNWLFLDATEDEGFFGHPSRQIQGKNIFIINEDEGQLMSVPILSAIKNKVVHQIKCKKEGNGMTGIVQHTYHGLSQIRLRDHKKMVSEERLNTNLEKELSSASSNLKYKEVDLIVSDSTCQITATVQTERNFTSIKKKTYLSLAFLPNPNSQSINSTTTKEVFYKTKKEQYKVEIEIDHPIRLKKFESIQLNDEGITFHFSVSQSNDHTIQIDYEYINENLTLEQASLTAFKRINQVIQQTLQKSIIYEDPT